MAIALAIMPWLELHIGALRWEMVLIPVLQFVLILFTVSSFLLWYSNYKKYYEYIKTKHSTEFIKLIRKDKYIDAVGEWVRWPVGSAWLLLSVFNLKEDYGDNTVSIYKSKLLKYFVLLITLFIIALAFSLILQNS